MQDKRGEFMTYFIVFILLAAGVILTVYYFDPFEHKTPTNETIPLNNVEQTNQTNLTQVNLTSQNTTLVNTTSLNNTSKNETNETNQTAQLHWNYMPLTYKIENKTNCEGQALEKLNWAMEIIKNSTNSKVSFVEAAASENAGIKISCWNRNELINITGTTCKNVSFDFPKYDAHPIKEGGLTDSDILVSKKMLSRDENETIFQLCYIATGAGGTEIFNALSEPKIIISKNKILNASLNIYKEVDGWPNCAKIPVGEIHQLFHVLGFAHQPEPKFDPVYGWGAHLDDQADVMFPYLNCQLQKSVDEKYFSCLQSIYSNTNPSEDCDGVEFVNSTS
jgi:hypothetical protein